MERWSGVLKDLESSAGNQRTRVRWRKVDEDLRPYLEGEAQSIARSGGFSGGDWRAARAVLTLMQLIGKSPDQFDFTPRNTQDRWTPTAGLGKALYTRVGHLSDSDTQAQNFVRSWMSSDTETFSEVHLPKLLRYIQSQRNGQKVPVEELLEILYQWEYRRKDILASVSREYFTTKPKDKKEV